VVSNVLRVALVAIVVAGCTRSGAFNPRGPCNDDGREPGAYPELEALLPDRLDDDQPTTLDSGRSCSDEGLGTLAGHDVDELRFAGATWDFGAGRAVTMAVLSLPDRTLPVAWAEEFYESGARNGRRTEHVEVSRPDIPPIGVAFRVDTLNDLSFQTVIVWPDGDRARVVLVATAVNLTAERAHHETFVERALAAAIGHD
jgi:hypothetical protein